MFWDSTKYISFLPANSRGRVVRPESWEYRGQYFYGYRPRPNSSRRRAARLLAAGLPLLLAPLLSIIFSFPVVVPVTQMVSYGVQQQQAGFGGRRRKREAAKEAKLKELQVVSDYLHQVGFGIQGNMFWNGIMCLRQIRNSDTSYMCICWWISLIHIYLTIFIIWYLYSSWWVAGKDFFLILFLQLR